MATISFMLDDGGLVRLHAPTEAVACPACGKTSTNRKPGRIELMRDGKIVASEPCDAHWLSETKAVELAESFAARAGADS